jgi:hypothetical protein
VAPLALAEGFGLASTSPRLELPGPDISPMILRINPDTDEKQ